MQGLLSYSDDEDEESHRPQAASTSSSSNSSSFLSVPAAPTDRSASSSSSSAKPRPSPPPPPPSHRPPSQPGPPRPSSKPLLPPNIVRKAPSSLSNNTPSASASTSAFPSSPLRQPYSTTSDSPPPPVPFPRVDDANSTVNHLSEEDQLKELLKPPRLRSGDGWEEEYGLKRLGDPSLLGEVDEALQTKTTFFLSLKKKGTHFNDSLMKNKAFRNPTIYKKLVDHVGVDERAGRYGGVWEWGREEGDEEWGVERIADLQKSRSSSTSNAPLPGSRSSIAFSSSHQSQSSTSSNFPPNPLLSHRNVSHRSSTDNKPPAAVREALALAARGRTGVVSGGKEYGFVGLPGGEETVSGSGSGGSGKRERGEKDGRHGGKGEGKISRWG